MSFSRSGPPIHRKSRASRARCRRGAGPWSCKPRLEPLEDRLAPAVLTVTTTSDSGPGSFRQAILDSNASVGVQDTIAFNIAGAGVHTIAPASALPLITDPVIIDGTTQPGFAGTPLIELDGAGAGASAPGLDITAGNTTVRGLAINQFAAEGIVLEIRGNDTIAGNFIGTNAAGTAALPNKVDGVRVNGAAGNTISDNVTSGNGTDGIHLLGATATGNQVVGNFVGINAAGTAALGNGLFGIEVDGAIGNTIGGTAPGDRNVVGANAAGIELDTGAQNNVVQGNFSGVAADGVTPVGNKLHGIVIRSKGQPGEPGVQNNLIGGTEPGAGNTVMFNGTGGVAVFGNPLAGSGQENTGNAILGNSIFLNGRSNPSFLLGIDLVTQFPFPKDDGVTPNTPGSPHVGPNALQNFPVLTSATAVRGGGTTITGTLNSTPNQTFRIELFANATASGTGFGEGQTFLGATTVTTDSTGNGSFTTTVPGSVPVGQFVSANATDPQNNTSEFAQDVQVAPPETITAFGQTVNVLGVPGTLPGGIVAGFASFIDNKPQRTPSDFQATITWGDGTSAAGSIIQSPDDSRFEVVVGAHVFPSEGSFPVSVFITGPGGASATAQSTVNVTFPPAQGSTTHHRLRSRHGGGRSAGSVHDLALRELRVASKSGHPAR